VSGYIVKNNTGFDFEPAEVLLVRVLSLTELYTKKCFYGTGPIHYKELRNYFLNALIMFASNHSQCVY
jgi:hypothetical protein